MPDDVAVAESPQLTAAPASEDTAAPEILTLPTETAPAPEATATAPVDEQTETEDPLSAFEEDALKNSARLKKMLEANARDVAAGVEGRHKQEVEAAQAEAERKANTAAYEQRQAEAVSVDNGAARQALFDALKATVDLSVDPAAAERLQAQLPVLGQMAEQLTRSTQTRIDRVYVDATNEYLEANYPDFKIAPAVVSQFDIALTKGDFKGRHQILLDIVKEAAVAAATPAIRTAAVRDLKAEAEKTQQLTEQRAAERVAGAGGPTTVNGRPAAVGAYRSLAEVAQAHVEGKLTNEQVRAYRAMPRSQMPEF